MYSYKTNTMDDPLTMRWRDAKNSAPALDLSYKSSKASMLKNKSSKTASITNIHHPMLYPPSFRQTKDLLTNPRWNINSPSPTTTIPCSQRHKLQDHRTFMVRNRTGSFSGLASNYKEIHCHHLPQCFATRPYTTTSSQPDA
uniref:Uncharacterized protein n=1 Tax=Physcomitrium patens TaxID=3218 RepID=A0A2K1IA01_PHYPA|nr:hypothetical protein PHYPA_031127 [Physcomitrium patens]